MNKGTIVLGLLGIFAVGISWTQWFFRFPDTSQLILGTGIGVCFLGFAYLYWWMKNVDKQFGMLEKRVDSIVEYFTKGELK